MSETFHGIPLVRLPTLSKEEWYMSTAPTKSWYACSEPERPTDPYVIWHYDDCRGCRIKAQLVLGLNPGTKIGASLIYRMDNGHWPEKGDPFLARIREALKGTS